MASMTDFRALCTELLRSMEQYPVQPPRDRDLIERARAALAQPEPPVDGEVAELVAWLRTNADCSLQKAATATFKRFHRIADLLERLAQPEPQGPTDGEILDLGNDVMGDCLPCDPDLVIAFARAVLARWGAND